MFSESHRTILNIRLAEAYNEVFKQRLSLALLFLSLSNLIWCLAGQLTLVSPGILAFLFSASFVNCLSIGIKAIILFRRIQSLRGNND